MNIHNLSAFKDNYIWTIHNQNEAIFVDPGEAEPVINFLNNHKVNIFSVLLTHHHSDHVGGVEKLVKKYSGIKIYGPPDQRIPWITHKVTNKEKISLQGLIFTIIATPGHTSSHLSYYEETRRMLFCGDTLFSAGCGRVFEGTLEELFHSLNDLNSLPAATKIYCAHEYTRHNLHFALSVEPHNSRIKKYLKQLNQNLKICSLPSTLSLEREINPFLRLDSPEVINYAKKRGLTTASPLQIFQQLRQDKDMFNEYSS